LGYWSNSEPVASAAEGCARERGERWRRREGEKELGEGITREGEK
jgi:hypothetical protein